jgi:hypothetical protein
MVKIEKPDDTNSVLGWTHFIKSGRRSRRPWPQGDRTVGPLPFVLPLTPLLQADDIGGAAGSRRNGC